MPEGERIGAYAFRAIARSQGDRVTLELHGELDLGTVEVVEREVRELRERGVRAVVLDLRPLTFIDSSGLHLLLALDADARERGAEFAIVEGDGPVRRLLELTDLSGDFQHARP